jgi:hypothetical protein
MSETIGFDEWRAICEGKARYCRFLDTRDWDSFTQLFTEELELDVSDGTGVPVIRGRKEAIEMVRSSIETAKTAHQVHSPEMSREGDAIKVVWAMQDRVVWEEQALTGYGHYHERWVKQGGDWKIASLRLTRLITEFGETNAQ